MNIIRSSVHNFTPLSLAAQALKRNVKPFSKTPPYSQSLRNFIYIPRSSFHTSASLKKKSPSPLIDKAKLPRSHSSQFARDFCHTPTTPFREKTSGKPNDKTKFPPFTPIFLINLIAFTAGCILFNQSAECKEEGLSTQELEQICKTLGLDGIEPEKQSSACLNRAYQKCQEGDWEAIEHILSLLSRLKDSEGNTLLTIAIKNSNASIVENLLERNIGLQEKDQKGNTPLHIAAKYNCFSIVPILLNNIVDDELFFDPNVRNHKGETPLHIAIKQGYSKVIGCLMEKSDLQRQKKDGDSLLHIALSSGQFQIVDYLISYHYKAIANMIEEKNQQNWTPLHLAAYLGEAESLYILTKKGRANIEVLDREGNTPLHLACKEGRKEIIDRLIGLGADVRAKNDLKKSPKDLINTSTSKGKEVLAHFQFLEEDRSRAKDPSTIPIKNLVFQGGGPKGIAYIVPLQELEERNLLEHVERVAGASAGAITAALVAVGYSSKNLKKELEEKIQGEPILKKFLDYPKILESEIEKILEGIEKGSLNQKFKDGLTIRNIISGVSAVWEYYWLSDEQSKAISKIREAGGLCSGDFFLNWIEERIEKATGIKYCTFGELKKLVEKNDPLPNGRKAKHLYIIATSLETEYPSREFSSEDSNCDTMIISDTVRMSMSIPIVYQPHKIHRKNEHEQRVVDPSGEDFIDGGLLNNFPIDLFDRKKYKNQKNLQKNPEKHWDNPHTVGFSLRPSSKVALEMIKRECLNETIREVTKLSISEIEKLRESIGKHNVEHVATKTVQILYDAEPDRKADQEKNKHRMVTICDQNIGLLEFDLSKEKEDALLHEAEKQTQAFFRDYTLGRLANLSYNYGAFKDKEAKGTLSLPLPSPEFSGRKQELEELDKRLLQNSAQQTLFTSLVGERGCGKSELAITFAALHVEDFSLIWKIDHRNREAFERSYKKLGKALGISNVDKFSTEELQEKVNQKLENYDHAGRKGWFLIFDNADPGSIPLPSFPKKGGSILITSTDSNNFTDKSPLALEGLSKEGSQELMRNIIGKEDAAIEQLAEDLHHIPLLLRQAASYIAETGGSAADYRSELLSKCLPNSDYNTLLKTCWEIAATSLQNLYPAAYNWLLFSSYLDNNKIPKSWLQRSLKENSYQIDYEKSQEILEFLNRYSLISSYQYDETFSLHEYFQEMIRASQPSPKDTLLKVLNSLLEFPEIKDYNPTDLETPTKFANILPHCLSVLKYSKDHDLSSKDLAPLNLILVRYLIETKRDLIEAEKYLTNSNLEGPTLAKVEFFYGMLYSKQAEESKDLQEKEQLYLKAHDQFEKAYIIFGEHSEEEEYKNIEQNPAKCNQGYQKAICLEYKAQALSNLEDFQKAETALDQAYKGFSDLYGKEHFDIAQIERERGTPPLKKGSGQEIDKISARIESERGKIFLKTPSKRHSRRRSKRGIDKILGAIEIQKQVYRHRFKSHKKVGATYATLGEAYEACTHLKFSEKMKKAELAYKKAISINKRAYKTKNVSYNIRLYEKRANIAKELGQANKEQRMLNKKKAIEDTLNLK